MNETTGAHRCALTHTNTSGVVAVCDCGWVSMVHRPPAVHVPGPSAGWLDVAAAEQSAVAEYGEHVRADQRAAALAMNERTRLGALGRRRFGHA